MNVKENGPVTGKSQNPRFLLPLLFAIILIVGIAIGVMLSNNSSGKASVFAGNDYDKLEEVLNYINNRYVDSIDSDVIFSSAIDEIFKNLDPHSIYISAEELARLDEPLRGRFEGIGVEFFIVDDTITVVSALAGGPSEELGIQAGDKIIKIEDSIVAGTGIRNADVARHLKGPKGSKVRVSISRSGRSGLKEYEIRRGAVKINSIDAAYMLTDNIGYIRMTRFAMHTHTDFVDWVKKLKSSGMKSMILDLRDNGGGYLDQATRIADELIAGDETIVYTEGRNYTKTYYKAERPGVFEKGPLIVMINENSASASEILAGALQDLERAKIVGRRSYGKALVQEEISLQDGAAMRLTVARYYTPNGRSIQRSYLEGVDAYNSDHYNRVISEYNQTDSFKVNDTINYGIKPDVYIPYDTSTVYRTLISLINKGYVPQFSYSFYSHHQNLFSAYKDHNDFINNYQVDDHTLKMFIDYNRLDDSMKVKGNSVMYKGVILEKSSVKLLLKAYFGKQLFYYKAYVPILHDLDIELDSAREIMSIIVG